MLKFALVFGGFAAGMIVSSEMTLARIVDEHLVWAALLPAVYLFGLALLDD
jgi:hypothetical protein